MDKQIATWRLTRLRSLMSEFDFPLIVMNAGKDLKFICGLDFHISERPVVLFVPLDGDPRLVYPSFETPKAQQTPIELQLFPYQEDPNTWSYAFKDALFDLNVPHASIGVSPLSIRFLELDLIQNAMGHKNIISAEGVFRKLYVQKDEAGIHAIKKAVRIAENALRETIPNIQVGRSEKQIANELVINLLKEGSEANLPFEPIVASGPNSANPHAIPSDRLIENGDLLIIDWGARYNGYISDITRTFLIGEHTEHALFKEITAIVKKSNEIARGAVKPQIAAHEIDACARKHITNAGYGEFYTHRTGHGVGLEPHENPYISDSSQEILQEGMTFTIEPGIYIPQKGGVRIEDNVVVTKDGCITLTELSRDLMMV